jgi:hypothetical protein
MDSTKLRKPDHLDDDTWEQHLEWLTVMSRQVEENFARHQSRVKEDESRKEALVELHQRTLQGAQRKTSLFCK